MTSATAPAPIGTSDLTPVALAQRALQADQRGASAEAASHWRAAWEAAPAMHHYAIRLVRSLTLANDAAAAAAFAEEAAQHHPNRADLAMQRGWVEAYQAHWDKALEYWRPVLVAFPGDSSVLGPVVTAMGITGRHSEVEELLPAALAAAPGDRRLLTEHATLAFRQKNWPEAVARWRHAIALHPHDTQFTAQLARSLRHAGAGDEAETLLKDALQLNPHAKALLYEYAISTKNGSEEARIRWSNMCAQFPDNTVSHARLAETLRGLRRLQEAEQILEAALKLSPSDPQLLTQYAFLAGDLGQWDEAITRWNHLLEINPNAGHARKELSLANYKATLAKAEHAPPTASPAPLSIARLETLSASEIVTYFESLGENCEFGLMQRHYGAEPLGLLRFAGIAPDSLLLGLTSRFEGVGAPEHTVLLDKGSEYILVDKRFGLNSHTFVDPKSVAYDQFFKQQCQRLRYLSGKLIEDMEDAEKIFVIVDFRLASEEAAKTLHHALRQFGPVRLLYVRAHVAGEPPGSVKDAGGGLMYGFLDRYGNPGGTGWNISHEIWLTLCRKALALAVGE